MGAALKPCGTYAAYRRHVRNGERVDEACAEAARVQKNERAEARRVEQAEVVRLAVADSVPAVEPLDELGKLRWNLSVLEAAMTAGVPSGMAALSKQHAELVGVIRRLESQSGSEVSALDQLAQRRSERLAAASP